MCSFPVMVEVGRAAPLVAGRGDGPVALLMRAPRVKLAAAVETDPVNLCPGHREPQRTCNAARTALSAGSIFLSEALS